MWNPAINISKWMTNYLHFIHWCFFLPLFDQISYIEFLPFDFHSNGLPHFHKNKTGLTLLQFLSSSQFNTHPRFHGQFYLSHSEKSPSSILHNFACPLSLQIHCEIPHSGYEITVTAFNSWPHPTLWLCVSDADPQL